MTTDLEQRKATALEALNKTIDLVDHESDEPIPTPFKDFLPHEIYETLVELLTPSPQAPDNELEEAKKHLVSRLDALYNRVPQSIRNDFVADMQEIRDWLLGSSCRLPVNRIYPAQQPRQEWRNAREDECMRAIMQHISEERAVLILSAILTSGIKLVKRELPEPPKDAK